MKRVNLLAPDPDAPVRINKVFEKSGLCLTCGRLPEGMAHNARIFSKGM